MVDNNIMQELLIGKRKLVLEKLELRADREQVHCLSFVWYVTRANLSTS